MIRELDIGVRLQEPPQFWIVHARVHVDQRDFVVHAVAGEADSDVGVGSLANTDGGPVAHSTLAEGVEAVALHLAAAVGEQGAGFGGDGVGAAEVVFV